MTKDRSAMRGNQKRSGVLVALLLAALGGLGTLGWRSLAHRGSRPSRGEATTTTAAPAKRLQTGVAPRFDPSATERAAAVVRETLKTAPARLSTTAALPPFDKQAYDADPQAYLSRVEPARCFQTAAPSAEGTPLEVQVPARSVMPTGGETPLWVKGLPGAPVTFTTFDGGAFKENGLPSVTVQADGRGLAVAHFTAGKGIGGDVSIVAGSPLSMGVQRFVIRVGGPLAAVADAR
jgi:hypothetical protein